MADRQMSPEHRSVVLVDWSRHNEPTAHSRNSLLYELMLLSLLYDEVLVQDEILVCSKNMARWFSEPESFRLFEELFAVAGIVLLKRPLEKYPPELQESAQKKPVTVRSEYLEQFSVGNDGKQLRFTNEQRIFQTRLEACLLASPSAHRDAGSKSALREDLMQSFGSLLSTVLTDERYSKWRRRRFPGFSPRMAQDFLAFVRDPAAASRRILEKGQQPKFTLERTGQYSVQLSRFRWQVPIGRYRPTLCRSLSKPSSLFPTVRTRTPKAGMVKLCASCRFRWTMKRERAIL